MLIAKTRLASTATQVALDPSLHPRLMRLEVLFPDLGKPRIIRAGYLRYAGEPAPQGAAWEVAPSLAADHDH